jgi:hypothetical protein
MSLNSILFSNVKWMFLIGILQKLIVFIINQLIFSRTSPEIIGQINIQSEFLLSTLLFISREGIRIATMKYNISSSSANRQLLVNLSWLPAFGVIFLSSFIYCSILLYRRFSPSSIHSSGSSSNHLTDDILFLCYAIAALIENLGEPLNNLYTNQLFIQGKLKAETTGLFLKTLLNYFFLIYLKGGKLSFGFTQILFSCIYLSMLIYHRKSFENHLLSMKAMNEKENQENEAEQQRKTDEPTGSKKEEKEDQSLSYSSPSKGSSRSSSSSSLSSPRIKLHYFFPSSIRDEYNEFYYFDWILCKSAAMISFTSLIKFFLTEGDKIVLNLFCSHHEKGIYSFAHNYGSLIARVLFLPLEDNMRISFSKIANNLRDEIRKNYYSLKKSLSTASFSGTNTPTASTSRDNISGSDNRSGFSGGSAFDDKKEEKEKKNEILKPEFCSSFSSVSRDNHRDNHRENQSSSQQQQQHSFPTAFPPSSFSPITTASTPKITPPSTSSISYNLQIATKQITFIEKEKLKLSLLSYDIKEYTSYKEMKSLFLTMIRIIMYLGSIISLFGPYYIDFFLTFLLARRGAPPPPPPASVTVSASVASAAASGSSWNLLDINITLQYYCYYLFLLGINGITEAFLQSVVDNDNNYLKMNIGLILSFVVFFLSILYLMSSSSSSSSSSSNKANESLLSSVFNYFSSLFASIASLLPSASSSVISSSNSSSLDSSISSTCTDTTAASTVPSASSYGTSIIILSNCYGMIIRILWNSYLIYDIFENPIKEFLEFRGLNSSDISLNEILEKRRKQEEAEAARKEGTKDSSKKGSSPGDKQESDGKTTQSEEGGDEGDLTEDEINRLKEKQKHLSKFNENPIFQIIPSFSWILLILFIKGLLSINYHYYQRTVGMKTMKVQLLYLFSGIGIGLFMLLISYFLLPYENRKQLLELLLGKAGSSSVAGKKKKQE